MIQTMNNHDFVQAFNDYGRGNQFTYDGLIALFDYIEATEDETAHQYELDVIALCCDFTEYDSLAELQENYTDIESLDDLRDHTMVIETDDTIIIQNY